MNINTNGMAGVMPELRTVTCTFNHGTCGAIDLMTGNAGADGINSCLLCRQNDLVHRIERVFLRRRVLPGDKKVLVISEQYPRCWAPKSRVIISPGIITLSEALPWGSAPRGPLATMVSKEGLSAPSCFINHSSSAATSRSRIPG